MLEVRLNNGVSLDIEDEHLIIKDKRLYNTKTKSFEGVDGDHVSFTTILSGGTKCITSGTVDGYTNENRIKLKGVLKTYENFKDKKVEHFYSIDSFDDKNSVVLDTVFAE